MRNPARWSSKNLVVSTGGTGTWASKVTPAATLGIGSSAPCGHCQSGKGERRFVNGIILTKQHAFGPFDLIIDWHVSENATCSWVLDQSVTLQVWCQRHTHFRMEPIHSDLRRARCDREQSGLIHPERMSVLILAMTVPCCGCHFLDRGSHVRDYGNGWKPVACVMIACSVWDAIGCNAP